MITIAGCVEAPEQLIQKYALDVGAHLAEGLHEVGGRPALIALHALYLLAQLMHLIALFVGGHQLSL